MFVVGVADIDMRELTVIGSKPSERHVFVVDDYDAFDKIQDNLITFICETATSSKTDANMGLILSLRYWFIRGSLPYFSRLNRRESLHSKPNVFPTLPNFFQLVL